MIALAAAMRTICLTLLLAVSVPAQDPLIWGGLEPGPHLVGFRSLVLLDESRPYDGRGRPILFAIWYPASQVREPGMPYEGYLQVPDVPAHPLFRGRLERFAHDALAGDLFHKSPVVNLEPHSSFHKVIEAFANPPPPVLSREERDAMVNLLATRTIAHRDAPPPAGRFPVILYHPGAGGSFEDNSLLCEFLAGHGYVVVSGAFESRFPQVVSNNIASSEESVGEGERQGWLSTRNLRSFLQVESARQNATFIFGRERRETGENVGHVKFCCNSARRSKT